MQDNISIDKLVSFFTHCRIKKSYIKSVVIKQEDSVSFQPIPKIQLIGYFDAKRIVRTVTFGTPIFSQIANSFGILLTDSSILRENIESIIQKEEVINKAFRTFINSEICRFQALKENDKAKAKLLNQLCKEISKKFSLLLSFPDADQIIPDLYNQAQVERVLKS